MEVAPQRIDCNHPMMPDYKCLQVREIRYDDSGVRQPPGEWAAFYGDIEGFEFRAGERKVLRLKKFDRPEPVPADASSIAYVLAMVVESALGYLHYLRWGERTIRHRRLTWQQWVYLYALYLHLYNRMTL